MLLFVFAVSLAVGFGTAFGWGQSVQPLPPVVHKHWPTIHSFPSDCTKVLTAAEKYLKERGFEMSRLSPKRASRSCPGGTCFVLGAKQLSGIDGQALTWHQIKTEYTWNDTPSAHEYQHAWSRGGGHWETGTDWKVGGYFETRPETSGCFVRIDFSYARNIKQYYVFLPIDEYPQSLTSNDRLEAETISGIEQGITAAPD